MTEPAPATRSLVVVEREIPHPPEKIWRALTQGPLIEEWLMKTDFHPVVGHRFNFRAALMPHWNGVTDYQVLVVEPYQRLSYTGNGFGRGGGGTENHCHLDVDADAGWRSRAHGAVGVPASG
jgi:Activator of Hsp90 ATPase homolog 1-like protein